MHTGIPLRAADTLRAPFDPVAIGFVRLARAPHILHAVLDAGQLSRLQLALASVQRQRDANGCGEWTAFTGPTGTAAAGERRWAPQPVSYVVFARGWDAPRPDGDDAPTHGSHQPCVHGRRTNPSGG
ncbi:hypothetical protein [Burkholderia gladioli]|uniref:hypothetical protein n=1 Tax=Burkholderia gladioli TaxID=28095 RepID=UPI00163EBC42|nr:hypothetical protein [Burkholderia gladioli]